MPCPWSSRSNRTGQNRFPIDHGSYDMPMRAYFMRICPDSIVSGNLCHAFRPLQESCAQPTAVRATDTATAWQPSKVCLLPPSSSRLPISIDYRPSRTIHSVPPIRTPLWHRSQPSSVPRSYPRCFAIVSHAYQLLNHSEYGACRCIYGERRPVPTKGCARTHARGHRLIGAPAGAQDGGRCTRRCLLMI